MIHDYEQSFIEFLLANNALRFGDFTLKSGRKSPYFINTGQFYAGSALIQLASYYSAAILQNKMDDCSIIFGPAYKGIPLCVSIASYFSSSLAKDVSYLFNRKESKDHGEFTSQEYQKNFFVGKIPTETDRIILVDDVLTTGGTKYEVVDLLRKLGDHITITGLVISVDREEVDPAGNDPIKLFHQKTNIPVFSVVSIGTIIEYLQDKKEDFGQYLDPILEYRKQWGVKDRSK